MACAEFRLLFCTSLIFFAALTAAIASNEHNLNVVDSDGYTLKQVQRLRTEQQARRAFPGAQYCRGSQRSQQEEYSAATDGRGQSPQQILQKSWSLCGLLEILDPSAKKRYGNIGNIRTHLRASEVVEFQTRRGDTRLAQMHSQWTKNEFVECL